jgi:hypothetical protein
MSTGALISKVPATGDVSYLESRHWATSVTLIATSIVETTVRCFLTCRFWKLSVLLAFHSSKACCPKSMLIFSAQNKFVTAVLVFSILVAVRL